MSSKLFDVWNWHGTISRGRYLATGLVLLAVKYNIDRLVAGSYGYRWRIFNYWEFDAPLADIKEITSRDANLYTVLLLVALPFIWIGTVLTLRRLRDAGWPLWLVILFFLPFLNLIFFIILAVIPSSHSTNERPQFTSLIGRLIPDSEFGSATLGILATALLAALATVLSAEGLGSYGWGLFVGIPFFLGLNSTLIYGFHQPRSLGKCLLVAMLSTALV